MEVQSVIYPSKLKTDWEKLTATYNVEERMRLQHNVLAYQALNDRRKYIDSGKWFQFAKKPQSQGGSIFHNAMLPILKQRNQLRKAIRLAHFSDAEWMKLSPEQTMDAHEFLFGDRHILKHEDRKATCQSLEQLKLFSLDSLLTIKMPDPLVDFTSATWNNGTPQADDDSDLTITANKCAVATMRDDTEAKHGGDYGEDYFTNFGHKLLITYVAYDASRDAGLWGVANVIGTLYNFNVNNVGLDCWVTGASVSRTVIKDYSDNSQDLYDISDTDQYIFYPTRSSTTFSMPIYKGESLLDTPSTGCPTTAYRYLESAHSKGPEYGTDANTVTMDIEDFDLQLAAPPAAFVGSRGFIIG